MPMIRNFLCVQQINTIDLFVCTCRTQSKDLLTPSALMSASSCASVQCADYAEDGDVFDELSTARCELIPVELEPCKNYYDFFDGYQYPYALEQSFQYPSASASYAGNELEENIVNLLDTDFLEICDELAKDDEDIVFDSSTAVAMPIHYGTLEAEFVLSQAMAEGIQHATLIEGSDSKTLKQESRESIIDYSMYRQTKNKNRCVAICKWKSKKNRSVTKVADKYKLSARQEATARRPRTQGKFKKVKAKWIAATEYFHNASTVAKFDDAELRKSISTMEVTDSTTT